MWVMAITLATAAVVAATPAFAQSIEWTPMDITVEVIDIEVQRGQFADQWTFAVRATNNMPHEINLNLSPEAWTESGGYSAECPPITFSADTNIVRPRQSVILSTCTITHSDLVNMDVTGWLDTDETGSPTSIHLLDFVFNPCDAVFDGATCSYHNIDNVIREVASEPTQCVAPPSTPAPINDTPTIGSAAYHTYMADLILSFDMPVMLAEDWHENMSILATNGTDDIMLDGLKPTTRSLMQDDSTLVWLSMSFSDYRQLDDITELMLRIDPGTILYGDGQALDIRLNVPVELVP